MKSSDKAGIIREKISGRRSVLVSFSGGVDSALLAVLAHNVLGDRMRCVFIDSPLVSRAAADGAVRLAQDLKLPLDVINLHPMENETFRKNPADRCYHCKKMIAQLLKEHARCHGLACVADGTNLSDVKEHRPGIRATTEEGFFHPFIEAGMTKDDIRDIARECGFVFWDKPSAACLASRIPYGDEITEEKLGMIERAETFLFQKGIFQARVRMHGGIARIEVGVNDLGKVQKMRQGLVQEFRQIGFMYVTLDLEGYRSGSMDEVI